MCGRLALEDRALRSAGISRAYPLTSVEPDVSRCIADAGPILERLAARIAEDLLV